MKRLILPLLAALSLTTCVAAPTVYQPAMGPRTVGYVTMRSPTTPRQTRQKRRE